MEFLFSRKQLTAQAAACRKAVDAYLAKELSEDEFRAQRGLLGLHRQKGGSEWMARIKAPGGRLDRAQVEALSAASRDWSGKESMHLTTRQDLQVYGLDLQQCCALIEALAKAGLSCSESGGASVRNISCPAESGLLDQEAFDPFPWALALAQALAGRAEFRSLPRKFKISFASEAGNLGQAMHCDLGFVAKLSQEKKGFEAYAGGGLGASPRRGTLLSKFIPAEDVLDLSEAVLRHFEQAGPRNQHARARLKYLVMDEGDEKFFEEVGRLRKGVKVAPARLWEPAVPFAEFERAMEAPKAWIEQSVLYQKQEGFAMVRLRNPQGDLHPLALQGLSRLMRQFELPELRLGLDQDLNLPWVPSSSLGPLYHALTGVGLGLGGAGSALDVVCCAGPETCNRGLVNSRALAKDLENTLQGHPSAQIHGARIHVSGCMNGCGHHLLAAFGLQGLVKRQENAPSPFYRLSVAGGAKGAGRPVAELPARRVAPAMARLMDAYWESRQQGAAGTLGQWAESLDETKVSALLGGLLGPWDEILKRDVGAEEAFKPAGLGASEC